MKRRYTIFILIGLFLLCAGAFPAFAASEVSKYQGGGIVPIECYANGNYGFGGIMLLIGNIIKWAEGISGALALLMLFIGGYFWIFGGASQSNIKRGRDLMTRALVGLAIVYGSWIGVNFFIAAMTGQDIAKEPAKIFGGAWTDFAANEDPCFTIAPRIDGKADIPKVTAPSADTNAAARAYEAAQKATQIPQICHLTEQQAKDASAQCASAGGTPTPPAKCANGNWTTECKKNGISCKDEYNIQSSEKCSISGNGVCSGKLVIGERQVGGGWCCKCNGTRDGDNGHLNKKCQGWGVQNQTAPDTTTYLNACDAGLLPYIDPANKACVCADGKRYSPCSPGAPEWGGGTVRDSAGGCRQGFKCEERQNWSPGWLPTEWINVKVTGECVPKAGEAPAPAPAVKTICCYNHWTGDTDGYVPRYIDRDTIECYSAKIANQLSGGQRADDVAFYTGVGIDSAACGLPTRESWGMKGKGWTKWTLEELKAKYPGQPEATYEFRGGSH